MIIIQKDQEFYGHIAKISQLNSINISDFNGADNPDSFNFKEKNTRSNR